MLLLNRGKIKPSDHFKKVFEDYFNPIVCFALRYVNNDSEVAQDIVQDSFIELWNSNLIDSDIDRIKSFLYLTTRNKALNYLKHEKVKENYYNKKNIESERFYMDQVIEQETIDIVQKAIDKLPEQSRKVILLRLEGLKNNEIAQQIGISIDTVKYHKTRAFTILKESLKDKIWLILPAFL